MRFLAILAFFTVCCAAGDFHEFHATVSPLAEENIRQPCCYDLTIPASVPAVRAVFVVFDRGQDWVKFYHDPEVRRFAESHGMALLFPWQCPSKERDDMIAEPRAGVGPALFRSLEQFAKDTGRADLKTAKVAVIGWSGAGSLAARLPGYAPDRVLAAIDYAPGQYDPLGMETIDLAPAAWRIPQIIVANGADKVNGTARPYDFFRRYFDQGAPWSFALQNRTPHCCLQNAQALILAWLDGVLAGRKSATRAFLTLEESELRDTWKLPVSNAAAARVGQEPKPGEVPAGLLPGAVFAREWLTFVRRHDPPKIWHP
jgi:hypothetical protein